MPAAILNGTVPRPRRRGHVTIRRRVTTIRLPPRNVYAAYIDAGLWDVATGMQFGREAAIAGHAIGTWANIRCDARRRNDWSAG